MYPELFENAGAPKRGFSKTLPKVDLSKTEVSDPDLYLRVNMVSGSFLPLFPRRSKMACPSDEYASCAFAVSLPKPVAAHFFLFRRELPSKTKRSMVAVVVRNNSTSFSSWTKVGCFVFVSYCFVFCLCFLRLWSISFITCLHDSQTTYIPSLGHKHVTQYRRKTLASKGDKQKRVPFELEPVYVNIQVEARFLGSIHVRVNGVSGLRYVCTPQNGSSWKRIRVHVAQDGGSPAKRRRRSRPVVEREVQTAKKHISGRQRDHEKQKGRLTPGEERRCFIMRKRILF